MIFDDLFSGFSEMIFNGCLPARRRDLLAGELIKARLMKASGRFDEALAAVDGTLAKQPDLPEALFLKAQILVEGHSNYTAAAACLKQVIQMGPLKDETLRRWSQSLLEEIARQRRNQ